MWIMWLIGALIFGIILIISVDPAFLMFAGGALVAAAVSAFTDSWPIQIVVFCLVSVILLFTARPWALRFMAKSSPETRMNADALIAKTAEALSDVTDRGGRIKLEGEVWSARSLGPVIAEGDLCSVAKIDGATALVYPKEIHG